MLMKNPWDSGRRVKDVLGALWVPVGGIGRR